MAMKGLYPVSRRTGDAGVDCEVVVPLLLCDVMLSGMRTRLDILGRVVQLGCIR